MIQGFNGATSFQTWKCKDFAELWRKNKMLQWGHIFSDMEMLKKL